MNTFHKALLNMRDDKPEAEQDAQMDIKRTEKESDKKEAEEVDEVLDEPQEELAQPSPPRAKTTKSQEQEQEQPNENTRKQKTSTDFTAPIRGDDDEQDTEKNKTNSPPRKSLAFASLPRRSPLKKSISTAKDSKDPSISRASWLSQSVKSGPNGLDSDRSSSATASGKRKSDKMDESTADYNAQSRKFKKSVSYEQQHQISEPKTPADALALKTAEIRKRLTQVAGTQRKVNLFDLPPKEAPISLASEPIVQPEHNIKTSQSHASQSQSQQSSVNVPSVPVDESTTPTNSPPKKRTVDSWDSRMSVNIPGAYPASDAGAEQNDAKDEQEPEAEPEAEELMPDTEAGSKFTVEKAEQEEKDDGAKKSPVRHEDRDEPMDLSELTQQQREQQEKERAEEEDKSKNKRKHNTHEEMEEDGNNADEDDQYRPVKQQITTKQPQSKPSLNIKPLQTTNKFRPRAGSTDNDKKVSSWCWK